MTPALFRKSRLALQNKFGINKLIFAKIIGVNKRSLTNWENGTHHVPKLVELLLRCLNKSTEDEIKELKKEIKIENKAVKKIVNNKQ